MSKSAKDLPEDCQKFYVKINKRDAEVTREAKHRRFDADDIAHNWEIEGFELVGEKDGWDFILTEAPKTNWYLIVATYSTGDSFHHEEGMISLVSFVKYQSDAEEILKAIEEDYKLYQEKGDYEYRPLKVLLPMADRVEEIYTGTWKGYFERLQSVEVKPLGGGMKVIFSSRKRY